MPQVRQTYMLMNEKQFGLQLALLRKDSGLTQEDLAAQLHVSPQAVSKWENGHSLPETALLPEIARLLDVSIDTLFNPGNLIVLEALFGDGIEAVDVTKRLNRLIENGELEIMAEQSLLGLSFSGERVSFLSLKYRSLSGICYAVYLEGEKVSISSKDVSTALPGAEPSIIAGRYGTGKHSYNVMPKIQHYRPFGWNAYRANHEIFPSDPANDTTEYLSLVYLNAQGIHMVTCAEGEWIAYEGDRLIRRSKGDDCFIGSIPAMPPFGQGMECSWAAALTAALKGMGVETDYTEVMGVSGACYRLAFCSPNWDYSSADGLVAYDYAGPGFAAFGYTPAMYCNIEKQDRAAHRDRIAKEIRNNMPVLGINLRVAPEWGVIGGYKNKGEILFCRTKYDKPTIENNPEFMKGYPEFKAQWLGPYDYLQVDNWPFLLCYFQEKHLPPSKRENLVASLKSFIDCAAKTQENGYYMGFKAYELWAWDLQDSSFYENCDDEQLARRFSVNQFCTLALVDARKAAFEYLSSASTMFENQLLLKIADYFKHVSDIAAEIHRMLDSKAELSGAQCRAFWTEEKRNSQAHALEEMADLEQKALDYSKKFILKQELP